MPHDVVVDTEGLVWYSDFGDQFIGRLNPKTGEVIEFPIPVLKKGFPLGTLDLQLDKEQNLWVSLMYQGGIAKFDRKTEKFQIYPVPKEWQGDHTQQSMVSPSNSIRVDGAGRSHDRIEVDHLARRRLRHAHRDHVGG